MLPEPVLRETQEALWELEGCGQGLLETSHRGAAFGGRGPDDERSLLLS